MIASGVVCDYNCGPNIKRAKKSSALELQGIQMMGPKKLTNLASSNWTKWAFGAKKKGFLFKQSLNKLL